MLLWDEVDKGTFKGLTRNGNPITKTYNGDKEALMKDVLVPPTSEEVACTIKKVNLDVYETKFLNI